MVYPVQDSGTKKFISKWLSGDRGASPGRSRAQERRGCVMARAVGIATLGEDGVVAYKAKAY